MKKLQTNSLNMEHAKYARAIENVSQYMRIQTRCIPLDGYTKENLPQFKNNVIADILPQPQSTGCEHGDMTDDIEPFGFGNDENIVSIQHPKLSRCHEVKRFLEPEPPTQTKLLRRPTPADALILKKNDYKPTKERPSTPRYKTGRRHNNPEQIECI